MLNSRNTNPLIFALIVLHTSVSSSLAHLQVGFYSKTCPNAEPIIRSVVKESFKTDPGNAAVLLRLQFHDCFVQGCDASILIDNGDQGETAAFGNKGVGGFDIIEEAKEKLESVCPGIVSCADIIALAARDAVALVEGPFYEVPTGRRDGMISSKSMADNLPEVDDSIELLKSKFRQKGLSDKDLVILSGGGHTVGLTACFFMGTRLYNFGAGDRGGGDGGSDPAINPKFLKQLKEMCPFQGDANVKIPLDPVTDFIFDDQIFRNIKNGFAVIASDARLYDDKNTRQILESYINGGENNTTVRNSSSSFMTDFAKSMVKMGLLGVKTGSKGEIRRVCRAVN